MMICKIREVLRNRTLLKVMRTFNKLIGEKLKVRIFTEREFKQKEVYNYVPIEVYR